MSPMPPVRPSWEMLTVLWVSGPRTWGVFPEPWAWQHGSGACPRGRRLGGPGGDRDTCGGLGGTLVNGPQRSSVSAHQLQVGVWAPTSPALLFISRDTPNLLTQGKVNIGSGAKQTRLGPPMPICV